MAVKCLSKAKGRLWPIQAPWLIRILHVLPTVHWNCHILQQLGGPYLVVKFGSNTHGISVGLASPLHASVCGFAPVTVSQYPVNALLGPSSDAWAWVLGSAAVCIVGSLENEGLGIELRDGPRVLISDKSSWFRVDVVLHVAVLVLVALGIFWSFNTLEVS